MSQTCPWTATLADKLFAFDTAIAEAVRAGGCPHCGARLHRASYPRKPRGVPAEHEKQFAVRLSLCCGRDGCRKRATPPSVRFLGPKVYVGIIVVIASALMQLGGSSVLLDHAFERGDLQVPGITSPLQHLKVEHGGNVFHRCTGEHFAGQVQHDHRCWKSLNYRIQQRACLRLSVPYIRRPSNCLRRTACASSGGGSTSCQQPPPEG